MKKITLFLITFIINIQINAQDKIPAFGKIDLSDLEMKDCDFDPGAEAVSLIDMGKVRFSYIENVGWYSESEYRVRIKVLKASAIDRANIKMQFYTKNRSQDITNISGVSYNLDVNGKIVETKMEKKAIFNTIIDKESSEISFALPDVKTGTVFEYKYKMTRKSFGYIPPWSFQQTIPVKYSAYNISIPEYFKFVTQSTARQAMEKNDDDLESSWYIMRNIPGLKDEPYSAGKKDYLQRVEFQLSKIDAPNYYEEVRTTWPKIINELLEDEDFGVAMKKNIKGTSAIDVQVKSAKSTMQKVRLLYNYVQSNMQWNEEYSIYTDNGIKDAWDKKNGNIADINFILISLLQDAGIDAKALLVSTKDNGTINSIFPFLRQFNCVMVYVKDGEERYIMNAADKYNPFNMVPYDVLYTNGLVVDKAEGGLIGLNSKKSFVNSTYFTGSVLEDGKVSGNATLNSSGYARNIRMSTYKKDKLKKMLEDNEGIILKADSIKVINENDELLPLEQKIDFSGNLQSSGEYFFLPYNIFSNIDKNLFVDENRVMDIDFSFPKSYLVAGTYILSEDYIVSELPKNTKMIMPDTSIILTRITQKDDNVISFRFTLDFKEPGYNAQSYPYIKEFFKQMYNILDERIVLKKK